MACTRFLRTDLNPSADAGGEWFYRGYHPFDPTIGSWNNAPLTPLVGVPINSSLGSDNPSVNPSGKSNGFYRFEYVIEDDTCPDSSFIVIQVRQPICPGGDNAVELCTNDPVLSIAANLETNSTCGSVTIGTLTNPTANTTIGAGSSFNPATNPAGLHTIVNTTTTLPFTGFTVDCPECTQSANLNITLIAYRSPGDERFVPYLSICVDPTCSVNLRDTLLNLPVNSEDGNWYLRPNQVGYPNYTTAFLTITSGFLGTLTGAFPVNTQISSADVDVTVDFSGAQQGNVYSFEYIIGEGTACEDTQLVDIYLGPIPSAGTPPGPETVCLTDLITTLGGEVMNLHDQLTGASTQGTWTVAHNGGANITNALVNAFDDGNTSPLFLFSGTDDDIDFGILRDTGGINAGPVGAGTTVQFTFEYTAQLPTTYLCANCQEETSSYVKTVIFNHRTGSTAYNSIPNAYLCSNGCTINLASLVTGTVDPGATWRYWTATSITDLIRISPISGAEPPANFSLGANLSFPVSVNEPGVDLTLDFGLVPAGTYQFKLLGGSAPCAIETDLFITVTQPAPECTVGVTITPT